MLFPGLPGLQQPVLRLERAGLGRATVLWAMGISAFKPRRRRPLNAIVGPFANQQMAMRISTLAFVNGERIRQRTLCVGRLSGQVLGKVAG